MSADLPAPLVPFGCDLRDFAFMPLDVLRLRDSDLAAIPDAEAFRAAVLSWCVSWHQVPAASLPDDDVVLCRLLGYGRDIKLWKRMRESALRGWVLCSDGRLYHPVVAEKAIEAHERQIEAGGVRQLHAEKMKRWRDAKKIKRESTDQGDEIVAPSSEPPRDSHISPCDGHGNEQRDGHDVTTRDGHVPSLIGTGTGTRTVTASKLAAGAPAGDPDVLSSLRKRIVALFAEVGGRRSKLPPDTGHAALWLARGYDPDLILAVLASKLGAKPDVGALSYFDNPIREAHDERSKSGAQPNAAPRSPTTDDVWRDRVRSYRQSGSWVWSRESNAPDLPHSKVPKHILAEFGYVEAAA